MSNLETEEEAHVGLMANVEDISVLDVSDKKVDFSYIYSLRKAYLKLISYNEHIISKYKGLKRKFKT